MSLRIFPSTARKRRQRLDDSLKAILPSLYQTARSICPSASDAEDLVHDTCVKVLKTEADIPLDDGAAFGRWLRKVLVNTFRDGYRHSARSPVISTDDPYDNIIQFARDTGDSPEHQAAAQNLEAAIHEALMSLSPNIRLAIVLHIQSGFEYQVIAELLDCPVGTVMSRISRGREKLRELLREDLSEQGEARHEKT